MDTNDKTDFTSSEEPLEMDKYQVLAKETDQIDEEDDKFAYGLLGLFGEVGTLLSALKKNLRDRVAYVRYEEDILEEFGDVLWYFSVIASDAKLKLSTLAALYFEGQNFNKEKAEDCRTFNDARDCCAGAMGSDFEEALLILAAKVGLLVNDFNAGTLRGSTEALATRLSEIFGALVLSASRHEVSLDKAVKENLKKIQDRWPNKREWAPHFDEKFVEGEKFDRRMEMHIIQRTDHNQKVYVIQRLNDVNIGNRLTDNKRKPDGYRFHDVIHMAFVAVLGWSPVLRALLKLKRKTDPDVDNSEDGMRAISLEEGISTWIFNYANRLGFFEGLNSVDYSLLKTIRGIVAGFEVSRCPMWQWEEAILQAFRAFVFLYRNNGGVVTMDMHNHELRFAALPRADAQPVQSSGEGMSS